MSIAKMIAELERKVRVKLELRISVGEHYKKDLTLEKDFSPCTDKQAIGLWLNDVIKSALSPIYTAIKAVQIERDVETEGLNKD